MKPLPFSFLGGGESFPGMMMEWKTDNPAEEIFLEIIFLMLIGGMVMNLLD